VRVRVGGLGRVGGRREGFGGDDRPQASVGETQEQYQDLRSAGNSQGAAKLRQKDCRPRRASTQTGLEKRPVGWE
jgi:hypothetical protein